MNLKEENKIPTTLKEKTLSFFESLKCYFKYKNILNTNTCIFICKNCNIIYLYHIKCIVMSAILQWI